MSKLSKLGPQQAALQLVALVVNTQQEVEWCPLSYEPDEFGVEAIHVDREAHDVGQVQDNVRNALLDEALDLQEVARDED